MLSETPTDRAPKTSFVRFFPKSPWLYALSISMLLCPAVASARELYEDWKLRKDVRDSELIVQGFITSVGADSVPTDSVFGPQGSSATKEFGAMFPVTMLTVDVKRVLKGSWNGGPLHAALTGNPKLGAFSFHSFYDYNVSEEVILCLHYDASISDILSGAFRIWGDAGTFVRRGDRFVSREDRAGEVELASIEKELRSMEPSQMVTDADMVAIGTIQSLTRQEFDCGFPTMCVADYVTVRVTEAWKGATAGEIVLVRALRIGTNLSWYALVPKLAAGETYLMFLKRDEVGFYPFVGFNGFLAVLDDQLVMNGHVVYPISRSSMAALVQEEIAK